MRNRNKVAYLTADHLEEQADARAGEVEAVEGDAIDGLNVLVLEQQADLVHGLILRVGRLSASISNRACGDSAEVGMPYRIV
jgi:hypothetical protein